MYRTETSTSGFPTHPAGGLRLHPLPLAPPVVHEHSADKIFLSPTSPAAPEKTSAPETEPVIILSSRRFGFVVGFFQVSAEAEAHR